MRLRAEHTWSESRKLHPKGQNETTDSVLAELRELLDTLKSEQHNTMPPNYEDELSAALAETEIEDLADIADGEIETMVNISITVMRTLLTMTANYRLMRNMLVIKAPVTSH